MQGELHNPALGFAAETVNDLEEARKAADGRLRALKDPNVYNLGGLDKHGREHPSVKQARVMSEAVHDAEDKAVKGLQQLMKRDPLGPWCKSATGVGEKQLARLLSCIGDPYWHNGFYDDPEGRKDDNGKVIQHPYARPRRLHELYSYCGVRADYTQVHVRGQQANWNATARMRLWNIANSCIRSKNSKYRRIYDEGRVKYFEAVHTEPCKRCGPSGDPAMPGSLLTRGHEHARAVRLVMRAILRDLYEEAERLHGVVEDVAA